VRIAVVGTGYVGLVVGACLAETGHDVVCADLDAGKIDALTLGVLPIYEPGLDDLVSRNGANGRLTFTTEVGLAVADAEVVFIGVGTPQGEDGTADLTHVLDVAETIGDNLQREAVVVIKSTVPVGTNELVARVIGERARVPFHMCSNPEFLKEGAAVEDFLRPDRVVLGAESDYARGVMAELYAPFVRTGRPVLFMDVASAELTKYAANAMLATRITLMNEVANLCERVGANVDHVRRGIGSDTRIGPSFLFPGPGYGGSCFPKDVKALMRTGAECGAPFAVLGAVDAANERQKHVLFAKVCAALGGEVGGARVAVWGLAFKPQTDDLRESPAITLVEELLDAGAIVVGHDPVANRHARVRLRRWTERGRMIFAETSYEAATGAHALVVATDWNEYRHPDFARLRAALAKPVIVDGRNLYDPAAIARRGFTYHSIGRATCGFSSQAEPVSSGRISATDSLPTVTTSSASTTF
jgi:UDPglucose 6-dehydrogenase